MSLLHQFTPQYPTLLSGVQRRKIFISYHHGGDQAYYNALSDKIHDQLDLVYDNSLNREIDSEDPAYVIQRIRDGFIEGTSCTLVLCGPETFQRKYVDWEIKATLDKEHGLIGLCLPTLVPGPSGKVTVPDRLHHNIQSGYASWQSWTTLMANPTLIKSWIEHAVAQAPNKIVNSSGIKERNG